MGPESWSWAEGCWSYWAGKGEPLEILIKVVNDQSSDLGKYNGRLLCVGTCEVVSQLKKWLERTSHLAIHSFISFLLFCPWSEEFSESGGSLKEKNNVLFHLMWIDVVQYMLDKIATWISCGPFNALQYSSEMEKRKDSARRGLL